MGVHQLIRRLIYGPRCSSDAYIAYLRSKGMIIGNNCVIYSPTHCMVDDTRAWMIEMGDNVSVTQGVTILTHGYDWSVLKGKYGDVLGSAGHVRIGSNVFIGVNATILKGVTIGDNVVIGANSLINKDVPSDCVVVGNPSGWSAPSMSTSRSGVGRSSWRQPISTTAGGATLLMANGMRCLRGSYSRSSSGFSRTEGFWALGGLTPRSRERCA